MVDVAANMTDEQCERLRAKLKELSPQSDSNLILLGKRDIPPHLRRHFEFVPYQSAAQKSDCFVEGKLQSTTDPHCMEKDGVRGQHDSKEI